MGHASVERRGIISTNPQEAAPRAAAAVPSADTLVARAIALRPLIREQQAQSAERGTYSPELHQAFSEAGFYRITAPKMFGGFEHSLETFFRVMLEVAIADPSTGWCLTLGSSHAWFVASHWPESAQRRFFAKGDFIAPHRAAPMGKLTPIGSGYRLSGTWDYASGVPYATHFIGNAMLQIEGEAPRPMVVAIDKADVTILDDWGGDRTIGMLSSGSNSVRIEDKFVPADQVIPADAYFMRASTMIDGTPGTALHDNPMYLGRVAGPYQMALATQVVGAAFASIDEFVEMMRVKKTLHPPFVLRAENQDFQRTLGTALVLADTAQAILVRASQIYQELCDRWRDQCTPIAEQDNLRLWALTQQAGAKSFEAVDLLFRAAMSSSSTKKGSRVLRYYGDVLMYRSHPASGLDMLAAPIGRAHLGLPINFMTL